MFVVCQQPARDTSGHIPLQTLPLKPKTGSPTEQLNFEFIVKGIASNSHLWGVALHHCAFRLSGATCCCVSANRFFCYNHKVIILQVCKVRVSPSSYFMAADVVQDNIILVAYANSGAQAAVVINRDEWDTSKQVMIQTRLPGDTCLTIESFRCNGCREQGWELVPMNPSHVMSDLCSRAKQAFETYLDEQWMP